MTAEPAGGGGGGSGLPQLRPQSNPPPPEGDGRLPDISDVSLGTGWDICSGDLRLASTRTLPCPACPPATRGQNFMIVMPVDAAADNTGAPQGAFFFDAPTEAEALWFDAMWIKGPPTGTLSLFATNKTNEVCEPESLVRVSQVEGLFKKTAEWVTACVPLTNLEPFVGLGFRFDSYATYGIDAFRFGPRCPD